MVACCQSARSEETQKTAVSQVIAALNEKFAVLGVTCCTLRFCLRVLGVQRGTPLASAPAAISHGKGRALALKDRHGREASHGGRMVTPGYMQARLGRKGNGFNIPHETQFWNCSRDSEEVHRFGGEVWVIAAHAGCLALPFATLVLAAFRDLTAFLLVLASDVELAFDVCLRELSVSVV
jgi:hypothetical protein